MNLRKGGGAIDIIKSIPSETVVKKSVKENKPKKRVYGGRKRKTGIIENGKPYYKIRYNEERWAVPCAERGNNSTLKLKFNVLDVCYWNSIKDTITYEDAREEDYSQYMLIQAITTLRTGGFNEYMEFVNNKTKSVSLQVLKSNCLLVNGRATFLSVKDAEALLFSIQNASNPYKCMRDNWNALNTKISLECYVILCANYKNSEVLSILKNGGI